MTTTAASPTAPQPSEGPLDARYDTVVRARFAQIVGRDPVLGTFQGLHEHDGRLASRGLEAAQEEIAEARAFVAALEELDGDALSPAIRFEREMALQAAHRTLFDLEVHRLWARKPSATDEIGDGIFSLFARDFAALPERLVSITSRLEEAPRVLLEQRERLVGRPVRLWHELERHAAGDLGALFSEVQGAGRQAWGPDDARQARLDAAIESAGEALEGYAAWLADGLADADDDFALGSEAYEELLRLRHLDGLDGDQILELGWQQLAASKAARAAAARAVDPGASEAEVVDRLKEDHPATFEAALDEYRAVMERARRFIIEHELATIPDGESLRVTVTPDYLRDVLPFAAYFDPPRFDPHPSGIYVVTPSVDGDPRAMREHNRGAISNTSVHEAYPGHHLQLSAAVTQPSPTRWLVDAPEFVEGWGMYCEQMMREEGFDAEPRHLVTLHTDAIWRACRIILDVRLQRGELSAAEAAAWLAEQTAFETANARAEVNHYTSTPTYPLSYLVGKQLLLRLRDDERRRQGADFSLRRFHDALLYAGSLPIAFQRRLLAGEGEGPAIPRPLPGGDASRPARPGDPAGRA